MSKRRATVTGGEPATSKRARTDESEEAPTQRERRHRRSRRDEDDDEEQDENDEEQEDAEAEEREFEEKNTDRIRALIESKRKVQGSIADHGIIESIEMHHFMCHRFLTFSFGPQINFIIGHNGSGKSAVLSAITVALGGKSASTGRGSGLKSFIREGEHTAEVTISIKNQGEEAYRPKDYGKSIVITRRFTREGTSTWKIKSRDGRLISNKREELSSICDHMNIQVDNPMNVLTQDAARQFLSASHPADKYKFFLRGTQLTQLSEEYDTCLENISHTSKVVATRRAALPELKEAFREATTRFEEASKAREQRSKVSELKKELAWSHVAKKQNELQDKFKEVASQEKRLSKIQGELEKAEAEFLAASAEVEIRDSEHKALGDMEHLTAQRRAVQDQIRNNKKKLEDFKNEGKTMDQSLRATNTQIADYTSRIEEEAKRMERHSQAKREEVTRRLETARKAVQDMEAHLQELGVKKRIKNDELTTIKQQGHATEAQRDEARTKIAACETQIARCVDQEKNALAVFGRNIPALLERIRGSRWHGEMPVGPLGVHVKVRDPKWAPLMRIQLGQFMTAFACTDARDRPALKGLLEKSGNGGAMIIISQREMFDFSQGEPPADMLTMLRALDINDPFALRILVNQARIERTFLAWTRREGQDLLRGVPGGGMCLTADGFRVNKFSDGGGSSNPVQRLNNNDPRQLLFNEKDAASQLRHWQEQKAAAEAQHTTANEQIKQSQKVYKDIQQALSAFMNDEGQTQNTLRQAKTAHSALQEEANEDLPVGITALQDAKAEAEAEKSSILAQFEELMKQKAVVDDAQKPLVTQSSELKHQIEEFEDRRRAAQTKIEDAAGKRLTAQNSKNHYAKKLDEDESKLKNLRAEADKLQEEFENWTKKAEDYCERVHNPRKSEEVQRNLDSVQAALKEREKRHGATVEEMTIEVNKTKANLDTAQRDIKHMGSLIKALKASLVVRLSRWQEFRRHIALRCKLVFQFHLSNRGYYGKVLFDHVKSTLQLKVQTDDQAATQGIDKDPRSLSGGEKSFSTICLLLSLWDSIGCPLRCLDEFDVFMDAVNRRISMKMMIDTANTSDKKQYVLITPQDMNNVQIGQTVRVHRMTDPERNQGTLSF